jgi:ribosomal protein L9
VEVPDGYAENFLFPQFVAVKSEEKPEEEKSVRGRPAMSLIDDSDAIAVELDGQELLVPMQLGKQEGKLKTFVTANDVRRTLKDLGHAVEKSLIHVPEGIDEPGEFEITIGKGAAEDRAKVRIVVEGV